MTVKQMIEQLQQWPETAEVRARYGDREGLKIVAVNEPEESWNNGPIIWVE